MKSINPLSIYQTSPLDDYLIDKKAIDTTVMRVLNSGRYILGQEVAAFEKEFRAYLGVRYAFGVASGTDALFLALKACGIKHGDEVITVSHTAVATVAAIKMCGATPVFADILASTYTLDTEQLGQALTSKTTAIVPVHLYGQPADMLPILKFARDNNLRVIEDCAQAAGAEYKVQDNLWKKVGSFGDAAAFSFYPTKNLGAIGDGGCIVTKCEDISERIQLLRQYGWKERYISHSDGWNSRLDEIQAAILRIKLKTLDKKNKARQTIAKIYNNRLINRRIVKPIGKKDRKHVYHQYVIRVPDRDYIKTQLSEMGIQSGIHYPVPVHLQPAYYRIKPNKQLPITEKISKEILSLPIYPELRTSETEFVVECLLSLPCFS